MKTNKLLIIIFTLVLVFSVVGFGNEAIEKIEAYLVSDLKFEVDGEEWSPKDVDGSPLIPLNFKGRTYVPVRSLLEDKGVTVGYEADTRTVLLDYSTMKPIDKASPLLMTVSKDGPGGGSGKATFNELSIEKNHNLELDSISVEQEITLEVSEDGKIYAWGSNRREEMSLKELAASDETIAIEKANFKIDQETGLVTSIELYENGEEVELGRDIDITVEISGPPFKIKVIIKF